MLKNKVVISGILTAILLCGGAALSQKQPVENINPKLHPNLAAAQRLVDQAYNKIAAAQQANEFDMEGHAQKAMALLDQVNHELKQAALTANKK